MHWNLQLLKWICLLVSATGGPENVKINIYTDEVECGGSEARRLEEEQQPPPEYRDVVKGSPTSTSQVL